MKVTLLSRKAGPWNIGDWNRSRRIDPSGKFAMLQSSKSEKLWLLIVKIRHSIFVESALRHFPSSISRHNFESFMEQTNGTSP
jgi:hypothetical protein